MQERGAEGLQFGPGGDELGAKDDLGDAAERGGGGKKGFFGFGFPDDVEDGVVVGGIDVVAVSGPIGGPEMDFDVSDEDVFGVVVFGEAEGGAGEVGACAMIPESGLDDFDGASVVGGEAGLVKLFEPKGLDFEFRRRGGGGFPQRFRRVIGRRHGGGIVLPKECIFSGS